MYIPGEGSGMHELRGIYLIYQNFDTPKDISVRTEDNVVKQVTKFVHILACGEEKGMYNDAFVFFHLLFWDGKVSDSIEKNKTILEGRPDLWGHINNIFQFVSKILLYINCSNVNVRKEAGFDFEKRLAAIKNNGKRRKFENRYTKVLSSKPHTVLDTIISEHGTTGSGTQGQGRVLGPKGLEKVRGHFKQQRYGKESAQSKIIWVEPYIRGEGAEFYKDRKYTVK